MVQPYMKNSIAEPVNRRFIWMLGLDLQIGDVLVRVTMGNGIQKSRCWVPAWI